MSTIQRTRVGPDYDAPDTLLVSDREQLRALGDDLRTKIIALVRDRARSIQELAHELELPKGTVGHHVKVLEHAGLIARGRDAQRRPCRLEARPLKAVTDWLERYRGYWQESYQRLDALLDELKAEQARKR